MSQQPVPLKSNAPRNLRTMLESGAKFDASTEDSVHQQSVLHHHGYKLVTSAGEHRIYQHPKSGHLAVHHAKEGWTAVHHVHSPSFSSHGSSDSLAERLVDLHKAKE